MQRFLYKIIIKSIDLHFYQTSNICILKLDNCLYTSIGDLIILIMQALNIQRNPNLTIVHPKQHKYTLLWIHGLAQYHQKDLNNLQIALGQSAQYYKIIIPRAHDRFVTCMTKDASSWFDIKFRSEQSFIVPFDQAFSSSQVNLSYQTILLPLIEKYGAQVRALGGKLFVIGFSQGCGMSIHCLYNKPDLVDAAIGISGYFFPITKFQPTIKNRLVLIYGLADNLRPWQYVKVTYYGRLSEKQMILVEGMKHEINKDTIAALKSAISNLLK